MGFALGATMGIGAYIISFNESLAFLGTVPWLTWISLLPTAFGLIVGSKLMPDTIEKQARVDEFLSGLGDGAPSVQPTANMRDGFYAMQIIGMTCALLGALLVVAVILTASFASGLLSIGVGSALALGGLCAVVVARTRIRNLEDKG